MHIFIDESGSFVYTQEQPGWSAICAVVIPESALGEAERALQDFKIGSGHDPSDELKLGDVGDEMMYFRLLIRLHQANCTIYGIATDAHLNTPDAVSAHKEDTAQAILRNLDKMHHEAGRRVVQRAADQVRGLSSQLYIQFTCQIKLMYYVVSQVVMYYAQCEPSSLSQFIWRVDQKALEKKTQYEEAFEELSPAFLQMMSLADPVVTVAEFDYSYLSPYEFPLGDAPTYLKDDYNIDTGSSGVLNIQKIVRGDIQFVDSQKSFGVQLADLLSAGLRRCLRSGFKDNPRAAAFLGRLMVQQRDNRYPLLLVSLGKEAVVDERTALLVDMMRRQQRPMLARKRDEM